MQTGRKTQLLDKYLKLYQKKPKSRVFAPLAESYRQLGMIKEAFEVLQLGLRFYPTYNLAYIVLAHCYFDVSDFQRCYSTLKPILAQNYDNLKLQKLMGKVCYQLQYFDEALDAYKFVLFVNPNDKEAINKVNELEKKAPVIAEPNLGSQKIESEKPFSDVQFDDWTQVQFSSELASSSSERTEQLPQDKSIETKQKGLFSEEIDELEQWEMKSPLSPLSEDYVDTMVDQTFESVHQKMDEDPILPKVDTKPEESLLSHLDSEKIKKTTEEIKEVEKTETQKVSKKETLKESSLKDSVSNRYENIDKNEDEVPLVTHTLVDIYISQKHYGKALKVLQKILQMDPNDERCLKKLAEVEKLIGVDIEPVSEPERPQMTNRLSNSDDKDEFEYHKIEKVYDKFLKAIYDRAERALT